MTAKRTYLTVVLALLSDAKVREDFSDILEQVLDLLERSGACSKEQIAERTQQWEAIVDDVEKRVRDGATPTVAYSEALKKFPSFQFFN